MAHDGGVSAWLSVDMEASCSNCGHSLWTENRGVGAFDLVVYFDDDERSGSYAERVSRCPTCRNWCGPQVYDPVGGLHYAARRA